MDSSEFWIKADLATKLEVHLCVKSCKSLFDNYNIE